MPSNEHLHARYQLAVRPLWCAVAAVLRWVKASAHRLHNQPRIKDASICGWQAACRATHFCLKKNKKKSSSLQRPWQSLGTAYLFTSVLGGPGPDLLHFLPDALTWDRVEPTLETYPYYLELFIVVEKRQYKKHKANLSSPKSFIPFKMAYYSVFYIRFTALECCLIYGQHFKVWEGSFNSFKMTFWLQRWGGEQRKKRTGRWHGANLAPRANIKL